jgi:hypothetical protein
MAVVRKTKRLSRKRLVTKKKHLNRNNKTQKYRNIQRGGTGTPFKDKRPKDKRPKDKRPKGKGTMGKAGGFEMLEQMKNRAELAAPVTKGIIPQSFFWRGRGKPAGLQAASQIFSAPPVRGLEPESDKIVVQNPMFEAANRRARAPPAPQISASRVQRILRTSKSSGKGPVRFPNTGNGKEGIAIGHSRTVREIEWEGDKEKLVNTGKLGEEETPVFAPKPLESAQVEAEEEYA